MKSKPDLDKYRGVIVGAAIGDAMGMPFQFLHPQVVRESFPAPPTTFSRAPEGHVNAALEKGQYTDETQLMTLTIEAVLEKKDLDMQSITAGMVRLLEEDAWITPGRSVLAACQHLRRGTNWQESGGYRDGSKPLAFVPPIVLHHFDDDEAIVHYSSSLARIILVEPRVLTGCACFGLLLKNILLCRRSEDLTPAVLLTADRIGAIDPAFKEMLLWVLSLLTVDIWEGLQELGTGYSILESLFAALFTFMKYPTSFNQAVSTIVYAGDSADTTGFITGALCGAFMGFEGIPENMVAGLRDAQFFIELAERFHSTSSPSLS